jgi:hypothetical protein
MIAKTNLSCPYCDKCIVSFDAENLKIVVNPDQVHNEPCEHLCFAHFISSDVRVDQSWHGPHFPPTAEILDFFAEACFEGKWLEGIQSPFEIIEAESDFRLGKRVEWYELLDEPPHDSDVWLKSTGLFASYPQLFAREFLLRLPGPAE